MAQGKVHNRPSSGISTSQVLLESRVPVVPERPVPPGAPAGQSPPPPQGIVSYTRMFDIAVMDKATASDDSKGPPRLVRYSGYCRKE